MKTYKQLTEQLNEYKIHHKTYTDAVNEVIRNVEKEGYIIDKEEIADKIGLGPKKPSEGKTNKFIINLENGTNKLRVGKKKLHIQIYGMKNSYELNYYIS